MESQEACETFLRSVEKRNLKYTQFVRDGDTGTFAKVRDSWEKVFKGNYVVVKEECVGHVQKRMGSCLREPEHKRKGEKLSDVKVLGGKGRLTGKIIDKIQNYYGEAIRNNPGDIEGMELSIWAIFKHMIWDESIILDEQHKLCPKNSWYSYWSNRGSYNDDKRLPSSFLDVLKPVFKNLTKNELLNRCLKGLTQNQNQAINGILWSKSPKTKFCGKTKVVLAVTDTVSYFNTGAASQIALLNSISIESSSNMFSAMRKQDQSCIVVASKKISEKARMQRRKIRAKKLNKKDEMTVQYQAGSFVLSREPEDITSVKKNQKE